MLNSYRFKISSTFFLLSVILTGIFFISLYLQTVQSQTRSIRADLERTAALGATSLDADRIAQMPLGPGCEKHPYFEELVRSLKQTKASDPSIDDVYVLIPKSKTSFVWLANANRDSGPAVTCGESYDVSKIPALMTAQLKPSVDEKVLEDKWGFWISGYSPIRNDRGLTVGILGVDMAAKVFQSLRSDFVKNYAFTLLAVLLLSFVIGIISSNYLSRSVACIVQGMEKAGDGDLDHQVCINSGDEFEKIAKIFNCMTRDLKENMKKLEESTREKERINRELEIAAGLQRNALPKSTPEVPGMDIAADSIPARQVGGDYFDFVTSQNNHVGFVIADAAGKGLPGTIFMTNSRSAFKIISRDENSPSKVLNKANEYIAVDTKDAGGFITFFYGIYDIVSKRFLFANAGHNPQLLFRKTLKGGHRLLEAGATPIGVLHEELFPEESVSLEKDDILVLYTDGVVDATDSKGERFELPRLVETVQRHSGEQASYILSKIKEEVQSFVGNEPQFDDITLVVIKIK